MAEPQHRDDLTRWLSALSELTAAASASRDQGEVLDMTARFARTLLGYDFCAVFVPDPSETRLVVGGSSGLSAAYVGAINAGIPIQVGSFAPASRAFQSGAPVALADITVEPGFAPWGEGAAVEGFRSLASVPLRSDGIVLGAMTAYRRSPHSYSETELARLMLLADHAALGIAASRMLNDLRTANEQLTRQRDLLARAEAIHRRFVDVALDAGGVGGIARALSGLLHRAVLVEGVDGAVLAASGAGVAVLQGLDRAPVRTESDSGVVEIVVDGTRVLTAAVSAVDGVLARVCVAQGPDVVDELDIRAIEQAVIAVALELSRGRRAAEVDRRLRSELLSDLMTGVDESQLRDRALQLGHDLSIPHVALVALPTSAGRDGVESALDAVVGLSSETTTIPRPLVATAQGALVVLWPQDPAATASEQAVDQRLDAVYDRVRRLAGPTLAVSTASREPSSPATSLRVARGALRFVRGLGRIDGLTRVSELGLRGLLFQLNPSPEVAAFVEDRLGPLFRYDAQHGTDLVGTLRVHLANGLNRAMSAGILHIHPNTVSQRVKRIEELTHADLRLPETLLDFTAALAVRDVVGDSA